MKWYHKNRGRALDNARKAFQRASPERRARLRELASKFWKGHPEELMEKIARRRFAARNAAPKWANRFFMQEAYDLARRRTKATGIRWHVDHIVPLLSPLVCGLHVEHNLQVIPAAQNISKNNRWWPDMPT